jgi:hypothetical protein
MWPRASRENQDRRVPEVREDQRGHKERGENRGNVENQVRQGLKGPRDPEERLAHPEG